jgi:hypothetical protein
MEFFEKTGRGISRGIVKGVAAHTLGIMLLLAVFLFVIFIIVFSWANIQNMEANKSTCLAKLLNYCTEWWKKSFKEIPYSWSEKAPQNCEQKDININQPVNPDDCKALLQIS